MYARLNQQPILRSQLHLELLQRLHWRLHGRLRWPYALKITTCPIPTQTALTPYLNLSCVWPHVSTYPHRHVYVTSPRRRRQTPHTIHLRNLLFLLRNWPLHQACPRLNCIPEIFPNRRHQQKVPNYNGLPVRASYWGSPLPRQWHDPHLQIRLRILCPHKR